MATLKDGEVFSRLKGYQIVVYADIALCFPYSVAATLRPENENIMLFDFTLTTSNTSNFFETNITLLKDKPTDVNLFALSLTI